jgi:HEAT repeat protein
MKKSIIISGLLTLLLGLAVEAATVEDLLKEFRGLAGETERSVSELQTAMAQVMESLAPGLESEDVNVRQQAQGALQDMALRAGRPGADAEQEVLTGLLVKYSASDKPFLTRVWCIRMLEQMGGAECIEALDRYLDDDEVRISDGARRALQRNPDSKAADVLRRRLNRAETARDKIGFMTALAWRGDRDVIPVLLRNLEDSDEQVVFAAANSLGKLPDVRAARQMMDMRDNAGDELKSVLTDAILLSAEGLEGRAGFTIYRRLYANEEPQSVRLAALVGLSKGPAERVLPILQDATRSDDYLIRTTAVRLLTQTDNPGAARILSGLLSETDGEEQAQVLQAIKDLGDPRVLPLVLDVAQGGDVDAAVSALDVIATLGDSSMVPRLAALASRSEGRVRDAAREALGQISGAGVNAEILKLAQRAEGPVRAELIRTLSRRGAEDALDSILLMLAKDLNPEVREAGLQAVAALGNPEDLPQLVQLVALSTRPLDQGQVKDAFSALFAKMSDADAKSAPILEGISKAGGPGKAMLMEVLGLTGSDKALQALRNGLSSSEPAIRSAAIAGLAIWPDARAGRDLRDALNRLPVGKDRATAFAGVLRAIGLAENVGDEQLLAMYRELMTVAKTDEERGAVLEGMSTVASPGALKEISQYMEIPSLRTVAASAAVEIAGAIGTAYPQEAEAAMKSVLEYVEDGALRTRASDVISLINRNADMVRAWRVAGPYMSEGKSGAQLFDVPFAPEQPGAKAEWRIGRKPDDDGKINLGAMDMGGDNRVAYLWSQVYVPSAMNVSVGVGSDDGVKVWLNGKLVHQNNANRPHSVGQDQFEATFKEGWNDLLLKVTNGGSDWAASARIRQLDGSLIEDMQVRVP